MNICKETIGQTKNYKWWEHRKKCVTSTYAHALCNGGKLPEAFFSEYNSKKKAEQCNKGNALAWGTELEKTAVDHFKKMTGRKVEMVGLCMHSEYDIIGSSPDGIVWNAEGTKREFSLEVKCPYNCRYEGIREGFRKVAFLVKNPATEQIELNRQHKYYTQCLHHAATCELEGTIFLVYTPVDQLCIRVLFTSGQREEHVEMIVAAAEKDHRF